VTGPVDSRNGHRHEATGRKRLLFVEDEESIRLTLPQILAKYGFEVTVSATLADAMDEIKSHNYDILVSDLNVSEINGGFTIVEEMHTVQPSCINFILTGSPTEEAAQTKAQGVAHYFMKPVEIKHLVHTIRQELDGRDSG
jgi:DNA-binding NtrC family response regulator